ncbi:hypothetical protein NC653_024204 [Populus alba x Populus x berolinensis]|uniref:Uncharacterized protein n=1 Tax=Populus alba x Populus x berolinensis TaxID=444605 RepID=A0AAD6M896_9ROSI|nr:hypothetical protein NC653_024204 [Populus alba x Populus x berolinensis]
MASRIKMNPQLEQIPEYENQRQLSSFSRMHSRSSTVKIKKNGFQRLNNIKDSNRQSKQLEELTGRMKECKRIQNSNNHLRLIKEFDREIKVEESKNPPEVNKQLNDEKQSMKNYTNT